MAAPPVVTVAGRPGGAPSRSSPTIGLRYGNRASFLPTTDQLIHLYQLYNIEKMWLYCGTPQDVQGQEILHYIDNHEEVNIQVFLYIPTPEVNKIARGAKELKEWSKLINDYQNVISHISLGNVGDENEIPTGIAAAMDRINSMNLTRTIKVSTIIDVNFIFGKYEPMQFPSRYTFPESFKNLLSDVFARLVKTSSPLFVKAFPYFAIGDNINTGTIGPYHYLLDERAGSYMTDDETMLEYKYVFDAMVDSVSFAKTAMNFSKVEISVVSGWPTAGSTKEATIPNAKMYNNNLLRHVNEDTPRKTKRVDHFIFSVLDEDQLTPNDLLDWKHFGTFTLWKNETFPEAT